jgi:hypothetical protein
MTIPRRKRPPSRLMEMETARERPMKTMKKKKRMETKILQPNSTREEIAMLKPMPIHPTVCLLEDLASTLPLRA